MKTHQLRLSECTTKESGLPGMGLRGMPLKIHPIPRQTSDQKMRALLQSDPKTLTHQDFIFLMEMACEQMQKINTILKGILPDKPSKFEPSPEQ